MAVRRHSNNSGHKILVDGTQLLLLLLTLIVWQASAADAEFPIRRAPEVHDLNACPQFGQFFGNRQEINLNLEPEYEKTLGGVREEAVRELAIPDRMFPAQIAAAVRSNRRRVLLNTPDSFVKELAEKANQLSEQALRAEVDVFRLIREAQSVTDLRRAREAIRKAADSKIKAHTIRMENILDGIEDVPPGIRGLHEQAQALGEDGLPLPSRYTTDHKIALRDMLDEIGATLLPLGNQLLDQALRELEKSESELWTFKRRFDPDNSLTRNVNQRTKTTNDLLNTIAQYPRCEPEMIVPLGSMRRLSIAEVQRHQEDVIKHGTEAVLYKIMAWQCILQKLPAMAAAAARQVLNHRRLEIKSRWALRSPDPSYSGPYLRTSKIWPLINHRLADWQAVHNLMTEVRAQILSQSTESLPRKGT